MADRVEEEFIYEYWDCPKCGNKSIRGDEYKCNSCGYPRDNSITFYRKETEEKIESQETIQDFQQGPDWVCSFCESLNHQKDAVCKGCGATKEDSKKNYFDELQKREEKEKKKANPEKPINTNPIDQKKSGCLKLSSWAMGIFLLFGGFLCWGMSTHKESFQVESVEWTRAIPVERYILSDHSDWQGELKGDDPVVISKRSEIRRYDKVVAGTHTEYYNDTERYQTGTREECSTSYSSTGSGASKKTKTCRDVAVYSTRTVRKSRTVTDYKDVPVYDTKVFYKSKGYSLRGYFWKKGKDNSPKWPEVKLGSGVDGKADKEGEKLDYYRVDLKKISGKDGPESKSIKVSESLFKDVYLVNKELELNVNRLGFIDFEQKEEDFDDSKYREIFDKVFQNSLE